MSQRIVRSLAILLAGVSGATALSQSFNIDLDIGLGDPFIGNGAPSSAFGGAANQPGYWNRVTSHASILRSLNNTLTNVRFESNSSGALGYRNELNTGDYALLLNDAFGVGHDFTMRLFGLTEGWYQVITYGVRPNGGSVQLPIKVEGAVAPNPQTVTGPMPGNSFSYLITHTDHLVYVYDSLTISPRHPGGVPNAYVNGLQVMVVSEPGSLWIGSGFLVAVLRSRLAKKKRER